MPFCLDVQGLACLKPWCLRVDWLSVWHLGISRLSALVLWDWLPLRGGIVGIRLLLIDWLSDAVDCRGGVMFSVIDAARFKVILCDLCVAWDWFPKQSFRFLNLKNRNIIFSPPPMAWLTSPLCNQPGMNHLCPSSESPSLAICPFRNSLGDPNARRKMGPFSPCGAL